MIKILLSILLYIVICFGNSMWAQTVEQQFQKVVDSIYKATPEAVGIAIHVESPDKNISWSGAVGVSKKESNESLGANQPVLIASNTKTYVAAAILRLVEENTLLLNQSLRELLSDKTCKLLTATGYDIGQITLIHLLSHTSGIADYVNDEYFDFVDANKKYQWTRAKQIELAMKVGKPLGRPGTIHQYADINYLLLTEIIELKTQMPFYEAIRNLLYFQENNLNLTWFIDLEKTSEYAASFAHQYWKQKGWDSYSINPSWDLYGGGGLAATVKDMALFYQVLFTGKIIKDAKLLGMMYTPVNSSLKTNYCLGLRTLDFGGFEAYYHGGFWGTDVLYVPKLNITIACYTLEKETRDVNAFISKEILKILKE